MSCRQTVVLVSLLASGAALLGTARAEVLISPEIPSVVADTVTVGVSSWSVVEIGRFTPGRKLKAVMSVVGGAGDMSASITDEANLNFFRQGLPFRAFAGDRHTSPISVEGSSWGYGKYYLLLDNRQSILAGRNVSFRVDYMEKVDAKVQKQMKEQFEKLYSLLKDEYDFPDFNIHVAPCGQPNAFSSPDITLCIELMAELFAKERQNALVGIFIHELGHTLLNLWGLPGYDNEDIADEFAAAVMLGDASSDTGGQVISDMITWFSEHDSKAQAVAQLAVGDRHAPSIQRVRNLERILENPGPVVARWNRLLYQHMTTKALSEIVSRAGERDDVALAKQILASREPVKTAEAK
jgi:hypothetical protein